MASFNDDEDGDIFPDISNLSEQEQLLLQILAAKNGMPSSMPSAWLEDEEYEEPYSMEEIRADPRKYILWAAENNHSDVVRELLQSNSELVHSNDDDLYTALHRASYNGHENMINLLLDNQADIHAKTIDGWQPFHSACRWDNVNCAKLLLQRGADINALTNGSNTALHLAASNGEAENVITFLLQETEIDPTVQNTAGDIAEMIASRNSKLGPLFSELKKITEKKPEAEKLESDAGASAQGLKPESLKVAIIPGNGAGDVYRANWYGWAYKKISKNLSLECFLENMPDPITASEAIWLPFMKKELKCDENSIIVGHSSGAAAALRYAENNKLFAIVLVSAYTTDLGDETERESGYFSRPWEWQNIRGNCQHIIQFGSSDDPFLPWNEQQEVAAKTYATFHKSDRHGHYMNSTFPELLKSIQELKEKYHIQ